MWSSTVRSTPFLLLRRTERRRVRPVSFWLCLFTILVTLFQGPLGSSVVRQARILACRAISSALLHDRRPFRCGAITEDNLFSNVILFSSFFHSIGMFRFFSRCLTILRLSPRMPMHTFFFPVRVAVGYFLDVPLQTVRHVLADSPLGPSPIPH